MFASDLSLIVLAAVGGGALVFVVFIRTYAARSVRAETFLTAAELDTILKIVFSVILALSLLAYATTRELPAALFIYGRF